MRVISAYNAPLIMISRMRSTVEPRPSHVYTRTHTQRLSQALVKAASTVKGGAERWCRGQCVFWCAGSLFCSTPGGLRTTPCTWKTASIAKNACSTASTLGGCVYAGSLYRILMSSFIVDVDREALAYILLYSVTPVVCVHHSCTLA